MKISSDFEWKLKIKDALSVNLNSDMNAHKNDWLIIIIESLSYTLIENIIMILWRQYDKEKKCYNETESSVIQLKIKTEKEAWDVCVNEIVIEVMIWISVKKKTLLWQIKVLQQIQDIRLELHQFLCEQDYHKVTLSNLFAFISVKQINH